MRNEPVTPRKSEVKAGAESVGSPVSVFLVSRKTLSRKPTAMALILHSLRAWFESPSGAHYETNSPARIIETVRPSCVRASTSVRSSEIMKSTWILLVLNPISFNTSEVISAPPCRHFL